MDAKSRWRSATLAVLLGVAVLAGSSAASAMTLQGITFPDTATVGGKPVKLNGMGLRKAYIIAKVYVAGLYLATPTHDGDQATNADEPKRMLLQFLRDVDPKEMADAMRDGFAVTASPALQPQVDQFAGYFTVPLKEGIQVQFDYVPGTGTTTTIGGAAKGTSPGPEFMRALWGIWLGKKPPNEALKEGLLGES